MARLGRMQVKGREGGHGTTPRYPFVPRLPRCPTYRFQEFWAILPIFKPYSTAL